MIFLRFIRLNIQSDKKRLEVPRHVRAFLGIIKMYKSKHLNKVLFKMYIIVEYGELTASRTGWLLKYFSTHPIPGFMVRSRGWRS